MSNEERAMSLKGFTHCSLLVAFNFFPVTYPSYTPH